MNNWNEKQLTFCEEYLVDLNGTQAAIRAGYSKKTARAQANQLLNRPKIKNRIKELQDKRSERTQITADIVIKEHYERAFSNIFQVVDAEYLQETGKVRVRKDADGTLISEIGQMKDGGIRVKLIDKDKNLELLGRHLGLYTDNLNLRDNELGEMYQKLIGLLSKFSDEQLVSMVENLSEN